MTEVANAIRAGRDRDVLPPIYSITFDKEERIRTYNKDDFFNKFCEAEKIHYVGFEFKDKKDMKKIYINLIRQEAANPALRSNVLVESTDKEIVTMIPEMVRGLVSKTKNKYAYLHHWSVGAFIHISGIITILVLSFLIRLCLKTQSLDIFVS